MSPRESNPERATYRLRGPAAIIEAAEAARAFGEAKGLAREELARLCIIVEELIANLYDHAGVADTDEVELTLVDEACGIQVTILDPGQPFDPRTTPEWAAPERGGGAGLALVRAWADVLSYETTGDGNRLELLIALRSRS